MGLHAVTNTLLTFGLRYVALCIRVSGENIIWGAATNDVSESCCLSVDASLWQHRIQPTSRPADERFTSQSLLYAGGFSNHDAIANPLLTWDELIIRIQSPHGATVTSRSFRYFGQLASCM